MYDSHLHSNFSFDSKATQQDMCRRAAEIGLDGLCFTEHVDFHNINFPDNIVDLPRYYQATTAMAAFWQGRLSVGCGLEIGLQPDVHALNREYLHQNKLDFIIGSIHAVDKLELCGGDFCQGKSKSAAFSRYFEVLLEQVQAADYVHVLGHFDVICRYCEYEDRSFSLRTYQEITEEIFRTLIARGQGIELNTGALRCGLESMHPDLATLRLYRLLGGQTVTVGSDAHNPRNLGWKFELAADLLRQAGFDHYSYFLKGQEYQKKIGA